ncbi:MAG: hypothetical protein FD166_212 [Bacteroidetes bacterium]|nr:MAG: hypothetical protein FD166_212 [Bacteroidota bacterium]
MAGDRFNQSLESGGRLIGTVYRYSLQPGRWGTPADARFNR